jgi:hypothetical protein
MNQRYKGAIGLAKKIADEASCWSIAPYIVSHMLSFLRFFIVIFLIYAWCIHPRTNASVSPFRSCRKAASAFAVTRVGLPPRMMVLRIDGLP